MPTNKECPVLRKAATIAAILSLGLSLPAAAGEVAGTVYDQHGLPVAGVAVSLGGHEALTGADGTYRFAQVAAGQQMVAANGQRVGVEVAVEGETTRNIFLLSRRARTEVTGAAVEAETGEEAFAEALERAEQMLENGPSTTEIAWRWNDHEA